MGCTFNKQEGISDHRDRLSGLPDDILIHTLSFLPTDSAVKTSLLSTRWRRVWASVPVLLFDRQRFHQSHDSADKFVTFVDNVITRRDETRIDAFTLTWHERFDEHKASDWLFYASGRRVRELDLDVRPGWECRLPIDVFSRCPSLEICRVKVPMKIWTDPQQLHWFNRANVHLPSSANLVRLRTLDLRYVMTADNSLGKLISECPVLEDLSMHVEHDIEISAPNLRMLTLLSTSMSNASTVRIFAPRLTRLSCSLNASPAILLDGLCRPVHAYLYAEKSEFENIKNGNNLANLLRSLRLADALTLDGCFVEVLSTVQDLLKQMEFNDLKYLKLTTPLDSNNVKTIFMFLESCPNLEKFVVRNTKECRQLAEFGPQCDWMSRGPKYSCNLSKLEQITVDYFLGDDDDELELMYSLLRNTTCLQEIRINYRNVSSYGHDHTWIAPMLEFMMRSPSTAKVIPGYYVVSGSCKST